jgi:hypothetical protein
MSGKNWPRWLLGAVTAAGIVAAFSLAPIPQDPAYHEFADRRAVLGIPNFRDVASNLLFVLVGVFGLSRVSRLPPSSPRSAYLVFCGGVIFIGLGSAYYHSAPTTPALAWDRLPMTVVFMAFFSMVVSDRISEQWGKRILGPLVVAGMASVGYWYWSELQGRGDLRAYAVIQFLPMLLLPLMLLLHTGKGLRTPWLWGTMGTYALAKVAEHYDQVIYDTTGVVSGHTLKHVLGALAVLWAVFAVLRLRR